MHILLFDRDGSNIQILLSLLAFNIVMSSDCPLIRFLVETSPQIRLLYQGFKQQICDVQVPTFQQKSFDNTVLTITNSRAESVGLSSLVSITLS